MIKKLFKDLISQMPFELDKMISDCDTLLDVGCGSLSPIQQLKKKRFCVGVDAFSPSIEASRKQGIHDEYYNADVMEISKTFKKNSFDCVVALDLIEHLEKEEGLRLLKMMEEIAIKKVIIFTPNGFLPQGECDGNPWQAHKSGWSVEEMEKLGYSVIGINGWKPLRGKHAGLKYRPKAFFIPLSMASQLIVRNYPKHAFQILCVKDKQAENAGKI